MVVGSVTVLFIKKDDHWLFAPTMPDSEKKNVFQIAHFLLVSKMIKTSFI